MAVWFDQIHRKIELKGFPTKIISLVPSQTELLYSLGLEEEVIGITKFCIHPSTWFNSKTRIGGTKNANIDLIKSLAPDLIIANKEENTRNQIEELEKIAPVWVCDITNLQQAKEMILQIGQMTGKMAAATKLVANIDQRFLDLSNALATKHNRTLKTAYLIWNNPYMAAGSDTFIHQLLIAAGCKNVFENTPRYPSTSVDELIEKQTELVLLSSEPFPFKDSHLLELQKAMPKAKILLVDGEYFSWYGSRLLLSPGYFLSLQQQIHG
jgi:ABC-type Fe3+-hydroxamate transport system substrate-binding protein